MPDPFAVLADIVQAWDAGHVPHDWRCASERGPEPCDCWTGDLTRRIEEGRRVVVDHAQGKHEGEDTVPPPTR